MLLPYPPKNPPAKEPAPTTIRPHGRVAVPPVGIAKPAQTQSYVQARSNIAMIANPDITNKRPHTLHCKMASLRLKLVGVFFKSSKLNSPLFR